jgi:transcriptional regulator with XRE-family HTH domain
MIDTAKMRALREKRGLTQALAAARAKMTGQQWSNIETGRAAPVAGVTFLTLERVAKALGVKAKDLLK